MVSKSSKERYFFAIIYTLIAIYLIINIIYILGPVIIIKGSNKVNLEVNTEYKDKGFKVLYLTHIMNNEVLISSNIDNTKLGTYEVKYTLYNKNRISKNKKIINVVDTTKPNIELKNKNNSIACPNGEYIEEGYSAIDNYDGDLTDNVKITKKVNSIIYSVSDSSGNKAVVTRKITRKDDTKPYIKLEGGDYTLFIGSSYQEKGYSAFDNCDGDISDKVKVSGKVNTSSIGTYTLTYEVSDNNKNVSTIERKVTVINKPIFRSKTIYLTFDDGPSNLTSNYLDILKEEGVKATFFINDKGRGYDYLLSRMANEGHVIANHTATHNFYTIYASSENFWNDFNTLNALIKRITGKDNKIFRFPGGSSNQVSIYNPGIMTKLVSESYSKNYIYVDWTIDSDDAGGAKSSDEVYNNVVRYLGYQNVNVVLMHDGKYTTLGALRNIIKYGKEMGFTFAVIDDTTPYVHHHIYN